MEYSRIQTFFQIGIGIFSILVILCTFGSYYFGQKANKQQSAEINNQFEEAKSDRDIKQKTLLEALNKVHSISEDIYFKDVQIYWIEDDEDLYSVGLLFRIFNKNNNRAYVINSMSYLGIISIEGNAPAIFDPGMMSRNPFNECEKISQKYSLQAGQESLIDFKLNTKIKVKMLYKEHPPILKFNVRWIFETDKDGLIEVVFHNDGKYEVPKVISMEKWENIIKKN